MATYDFRILLETVEGNKSSYFTSSFVNTDNNLVLSASQVYNRITGSISCSYQNSPEFNSNLWSNPTSGSINTSYVFKDNNLLSASLTGSLDTGAMIFTSLNIEYDRLLRYKFFGEKVCSTLGLPDNQWVYVDQVRLPADDESNYFEGNINAGSIFVKDGISFSNNSTIHTDIPIFINTGSDRHIKFIDERGNGTIGLSIGYDKVSDNYEITADTAFNLKGVSEISGSNTTLPISIGNTTGFEILAPGANNPKIELQRSDNNASVKMEIQGTGTTRVISDDGSGTGDLQLGTSGFLKAIYIEKSTERVGIGDDDPLATLHVFGDLKVDGNMEVTSITSSVITSSTVQTEGSNIFGDTIADTHLFNGHITASGNISSSGTGINYFGGDISASGMIKSISQDGVTINTGNNTQYFKLGTLTNNGARVVCEALGQNDFAAPGTLITTAIFSIGNDNDEYGLTQSSRGDGLNVNQNIGRAPIFEYVGTSGGKIMDVYIKAGTFFRGSVFIKEGFGFIPNKLAHISVSDPSGVESNLRGEKYYTHHSYNANTTDNTFLPLGLTADSVNNSYFHRWLAPYDGRLVKILSRAEGACDVASHGFATASNGTEDPVLVASTQVGIDMDTANETFEFHMSESLCQFNKGDSLAIMFEPATAGGFINTTVVWEYQITT